MTDKDKSNTDNKKKSQGFSLFIFGVLFAVGSIGAVIASNLQHNSKTSQQKVIALKAADFIAAETAEGGMPTPEAIDKALIKMKKKAEALAEQGYLVIDESAVLAWPKTDTKN